MQANPQDSSLTLTQAGPKFAPGDPQSFQFSTSIDRRGLKRQVPMKVLCLGLSRSGTNTLRHALLRLGYFDVYHFSSLLNENPPDAIMWNEAMRGKFENGEAFGREDWDALLGHCQAITDTPCMVFWRELMEAYPEAKLILTVRDDVEQWHKSVMKTLMPWLDRFVRNESFLSKLKRWILMSKDFNEGMVLNQLLLKYYMYGSMETDGKAYYEAHNASVIEAAKAQGRDLLVLNVKEGWEPLCKYLGHELPVDPSTGIVQHDFPATNSVEDFSRNARSLGELLNAQMASKVNGLLFGVCGIVCVAGVALGYYYKAFL